MSLRSRLEELGYPLPTVPEPRGSYVPAVRSGSLIFTAGQLPLRESELLHEGKVGGEVTLEEAREAAGLCVVNAISAAASAVGDPEDLGRILRITGYVTSVEGFNDQPQVLNAASELVGEVFGERGVHARSAVGVAELPLNAPVELELVAEIEV
jgi:enamine deaminase RidA (YjgF/YER057c/UK114 family)